MSILNDIRRIHGGSMEGIEMDAMESVLSGMGSDISVGESSEDPSEALDALLGEAIDINLQHIPPSERPRYEAMRSQLEKKRKKEDIRVYYSVFCFNNPSDCYRFESLMQRAGASSIAAQHSFTDGDRIMYWVALHVNAGLYSELRHQEILAEKKEKSARQVVATDPSGEYPSEEYPSGEDQPEPSQEQPESSSDEPLAMAKYWIHRMSHMMYIPI